MKARIDKALQLAVSYGGIDGDHHKRWVIDQMVRALTCCPMIEETIKGSDGKDYPFEVQGESVEYQLLVKAAKDGEDGPETYDWDLGVPP